MQNSCPSFDRQDTPINMKKLLIHLFLLLLSSIAISVFGQDTNDKKTIWAQKITTQEIILDGHLNEGFWQNVPEATDFTMQEPREGGSPSERTVVKIAFDEQNLYIGVMLYDADPDGIKSFQKRRDASLSTDDRFIWLLDTYLDGRNAYVFEINPSGLMGDALLTVGQGSSINKNWDGIWRPWTQIGPEGWSAEIRIPFRTLNFDPNKDTWGINFQRTIRRKNEELLWTGFKRNQGLDRPQNAGLLKGLTSISQGLGLEVVPYAKAEYGRKEENDFAEYTTTSNFDAGLDLNYNLTSGLRASFTLNTDFAETEVDTRQVNLTRFPLFFPERRDFFLEGANIYQFAPRSGVTPYFSRRIGLEGGSPVPINYGGRIIGRVGKYELAAQQVRTKASGDNRPEDFTAIRLKRNFFKESSFGVVYTRRHTRDGELLDEPLQDRHTFGADLSLNTSTFLNKYNLQFQAFMVFHNSPFLLDDDTDFWDRSSRGLRLNFPNQPWSGAVSYREFGADFDPEVGFNSRNAFRRVEPQVTYAPLLEKSDFIRELSWRLSFEHLMNLQWEKLTQNIRLTPIGIRLESGDEFEYQFIRNYEVLIRDFDILGDGSIVIPLEDYVNWIHNIEFSSAEFRKIAYSLDVRLGGFWSGTRSTFENSITLRPTPGLNISAVYVYTNVNLLEGDFQTNLLRFIGNYDISPFISFSLNVQYDDLSEVVGLNSRFRYTITPGSDLFLVYNHNWIDWEDRYRTTSNTAILKATYTHRF